MRNISRKGRTTFRRMPLCVAMSLALGVALCFAQENRNAESEMRRPLEPQRRAQHEPRRMQSARRLTADRRHLDIGQCRNAVGDQAYEQAKNDVQAKRELEVNLSSAHALQDFVESLSARSGLSARISGCARLLALGDEPFKCDSLVPKICFDLYRRHREQMAERVLGELLAKDPR